ncbi:MULTISPECIES: SDR family NAD(P)-dependent oxidoreductase [Rhodococcus]|uniref:NADP-dependent 3-hydroxy acid dehydrogenase YdfG n=1 Tax=Rhodococcus rhodochrous J45 TaxID=935266 RepID=A0A562EPQ6_RHORH|nr:MULTISPECIES: SDR family NAD(P)-dependent oxidoreductase [Rhodococcus]TWH23718.1 NADP-dependent 3-hydroxy acid dehydrogenase YdfG [Rhodococcus rhodochrous J45]
MFERDSGITPAANPPRRFERTRIILESTTTTTWFVTGASRGLGLEIVAQLLRRGDDVAATTRSVERLTAALDGVGSGRLLPLRVDLTDQPQVTAAVAQTREHFGGLDVVVNNAGYGYLSAVEEIADDDAHAMFDVQIFGVLNVLRAALPVFRSNRRGHIVNVSSILGLTTFPGWGLYSAGKFALEALTEALAAEVADLGIGVNLIEPGYVRTDFLTNDSLALPDSTLGEYPTVRETTEAHRAMHGTQLGDPAKVAAAIIEVAVSGTAPLHQFLGSDSLSFAETRVKALQADLDASRALAGTDHTDL